MKQKAGCIHAAGMIKEVSFEPVDDAPINSLIDEAYNAKYKGSSYLRPMISEKAKSATIKIIPAEK